MWGPCDDDDDMNGTEYDLSSTIQLPIKYRNIRPSSPHIDVHHTNCQVNDTDESDSGSRASTTVRNLPVDDVHLNFSYGGDFQNLSFSYQTNNPDAEFHIEAVTDSWQNNNKVSCFSFDMTRPSVSEPSMPSTSSTSKNWSARFNRHASTSATFHLPPDRNSAFRVRGIVKGTPSIRNMSVRNRLGRFPGPNNQAIMFSMSKMSSEMVVPDGIKRSSRWLSSARRLLRYRKIAPLSLHRSLHSLTLNGSGKTSLFTIPEESSDLSESDINIKAEDVPNCELVGQLDNLGFGPKLEPYRDSKSVLIDYTPRTVNHRYNIEKQDLEDELCERLSGLPVIEKDPGTVQDLRCSFASMNFDRIIKKE